MGPRVLRWTVAVGLLAAVLAGRAEAALSVVRPLSPTAGAQDGSAVSKGYAAYDPVNEVYLLVWSNFASRAYGQFINRSGGNVGVPFRLSTTSAGYARVVYGADGFLVTYNHTGTPQR